ncbi:MAG: hypothetical protein ACYC3X_23180 [Pirellulaceae bacterium]
MMGDRVRVQGSRLVVRPFSPADARWKRLGRDRFLNRWAFEEHLAAQGRGHDSRITLASAAPWLDVLLALGLLVLPFYALCRATEMLCPPAVPLLRWLGRELRKIGRSVVLAVFRLLWTRPAQQLGGATTAWLWLVCLTTVGSAVSAVRLRWEEFWGLLPLWLLVVGWWVVMRGSRLRRFRARALPARRRR